MLILNSFPGVSVEGAVYPSLKGKERADHGRRIAASAPPSSSISARKEPASASSISNPDYAAETARRHRSDDRQPAAYEAVDLRDIAALRSAIALFGQRNGPIQVLVNNAGNDDRMPVEDVTPEYWDERFQTNLRHQFFAAQAVIGGMAQAGGGSIINMGSISWMRGAAGLIFYTTAKSAVMGMTKSLARELGERNIRVNSIAPGWVLTERQVERAKRVYQGKFAEYLEVQCLKEHLLPPDIARMALWLAADDLRLVTAQTFIVDGGVV